MLASVEEDASDFLFLKVVIFLMPFLKPFSRFLLISESIEGVTEGGGEISDSIDVCVGRGRSLEGAGAGAADWDMRELRLLVELMLVSERAEARPST